MEEFLLSGFSKYFFIPLCSIVLGVIIKYITRNDQYAKFNKEDFAVGLDLIRTSLFTYVVLLVDKVSQLNELEKILSVEHESSVESSLLLADYQGKVTTLMSELSHAYLVIIVFILLMWLVSTVVRKFGWKSATELKPIIGITIPLIFGVLSLIFVMLDVA